MIGGLFLDGAPQPAHGDALELVEPWSGRPVAIVVQATTEDLDQAVDAARAAHAGAQWRTMAPLRRARILHDTAARMRERADQLADLETRNVGRPRAEVLANVGLACDAFDYFASLTTHLRGSTVPLGPGLLDYTLREPVGVCGLITPWNNPIVITAWKVAAALAAGNAVVVKPASLTPLSILSVAELLSDAGLPAGQLNVVSGPGSALGDHLVRHPGIDKVSFTGSTQTGRRVLAGAAGNLTRVSLELGGKCPSLVFADADLDAALAGSVPAMFANAGQMCTARSRILVDALIAPQFTHRLASVVSDMRLGDPFDVATQLGPVISEAQLETVRGFIERAGRDGARTVTGGAEPPGHPGLERGWFVRPTVLSAVSDTMEVVREEVFGPVLVVDSFEDEEDAVARANASPYGLAATVWTRDLARAHRVAHALEVGTVTVNTTKVTHVYAPFAGWKQSGLGTELGLEGLDEFLRHKNVIVGL